MRQQTLDKAIEVAPSGWIQYLARAGISCYKPAPCRDFVADLETVEKIDSQSQLPGRWQGVAWALAADLWGTCPSDVSLPKALDLAPRAATAAPNQAGHQITLGLALYRSERYEEARTALLKGVSLATPEIYTMIPALCTLAMTEWRLGNKADARATYARALDRLKKGFPRSPLNIRFQKEAAGVLGIGG